MKTLRYVLCLLNYHLLKRISVKLSGHEIFLQRNWGAFVREEHYDEEMGPINHNNMGDKRVRCSWHHPFCSIFKMYITWRINSYNKNKNEIWNSKLKWLFRIIIQSFIWHVWVREKAINVFDVDRTWIYNVIFSQIPLKKKIICISTRKKFGNWQNYHLSILKAHNEWRHGQV